MNRQAYIGGSYQPINSDINKINEIRLRNNIPKKILTNIKRRLKGLKKNSFKTKKLNNKYFWKGVDNYLPDCMLDLPIIKVKVNENYHKFSWKDSNNPDWSIIEESCIVVDKDTNRILCVFVYSKDDPNITKCVDNTFRLVELIEKYNKLKKKIFYSGFDTKLVKNKSKKLDRQEHYTGKNWLDGMQKYLDPTLGHQVISYYHRKPDGDLDEEYIKEIIWLYCSLYELEKRHCPSVAKYRYDLVKDLNFPGCFPGVPIELNPSTCMGSSINFSSDTHCDSSVVGTTETIIWRPDKTNPKPYIFTNSLAELYFSIHEDCMIYQVGTDPHGTLNTGEHGGVGFVNLSKKNLTANTQYNKDWYGVWNNFLKDT